MSALWLAHVLADNTRLSVWIPKAQGAEAMKIAIYCRVSTDKQDNENQLAQLREFASKQDWSVEIEYIDVESGSKSERPAFQRMLADASRRRFDLVLFWALDRLSREGVLPTLQYLQRLESYGIAYKSFTEPFLTRVACSKTLCSPLWRRSPNRSASNGPSVREQG
jgi:hypothetical protein